MLQVIEVVIVFHPVYQIYLFFINPNNKMLKIFGTQSELDEFLNARIKDEIFNKENVEYCFNFIIDSTLKLQEFDFEVKNR